MSHKLVSLALLLFAAPCAFADHWSDPANPALSWSQSAGFSIAALNNENNGEAPRPDDSTPASPAAIVQPQPPREREHWRPMLLQSAEFLAMQHAGNLGMDWYMRWELTHGNFFHKWFTSVKNVRWTRWNDDDPFLDNYVGHPMMGAITSYVWIQNDPTGRRLGFENSRAYWMSRLRGMGWAAA